MCGALLIVFSVLKIIALILTIFILGYIALLAIAGIVSGIIMHRLYGDRKSDDRGLE